MSSKNVVLSLLCAIMLVCYSLCAYVSQKDVLTVAERDGIRLPIVMYHLVLDDDKRLGKFIVSARRCPKSRLCSHLTTDITTIICLPTPF